MKFNDYFHYFKIPFPGRRGFSPYRSPGPFIHILAMFCCLFLGLFLSANETTLRILVPLFLFIGLYAGRDIAIYAHYNPLLTLLVPGAAFMSVKFLTPDNRLFLDRAMKDCLGLDFGFFSLAVTVAVSGLFALHVHRWSSNHEEAPDPRDKLFPLHAAAAQGDMKRCAQLLPTVEEIDALDDRGQTALHHAASNGRTAAARLLVANGARVDVEQESNFEYLRGCTAIHKAAEGGHAEMVRFLLENGADVNAKTFHLYAPIHYAAMRGHEKIVEILIKEGADLSAATTDGLNPLDLALKFGCDKAAKALDSAAKPA